LSKPLARDVYEVERVRAELSERVFGWIKVLTAAWFGGASSPQLYMFRITDLRTGLVVSEITDDEVGTDYGSLLRQDLDAMTPPQFAAKWEIEEPHA
jgi:hypothetical protein